MKIILQRVSRASVTVVNDALENQVGGEIGRGLLLYVGFGTDDGNSKELQSRLQKMAEKIVNLRVFPDEQGRFHLSLLDLRKTDDVAATGARAECVESKSCSVLLVPNFTLYGDTSKGRRPEFFAALQPDSAVEAFANFVSCFRALGVHTEAGQFGAHMLVESTNDGPVTMILQ